MPRQFEFAAIKQIVKQLKILQIKRKTADNGSASALASVNVWENGRMALVTMNNNVYANAINRNFRNFFINK